MARNPPPRFRLSIRPWARRLATRLTAGLYFHQRTGTRFVGFVPGASIGRPLPEWSVTSARSKDAGRPLLLPVSVTTGIARFCSPHLPSFSSVQRTPEQLTQRIGLFNN
jgi:hypothetical protein